MKAISMAYLAGVVLGDGWCTRWSLGMRVADEDFAQAFQAAITAAFGVDVRCATDERGYWLVRTSNKTGRFDALVGYEPADAHERAAWLRGMFDSEGNVYLSPARVSANAWNRRVAFFSTEPTTLDRAARYLADLSITTRRRPWPGGGKRKGTKPVEALLVRNSHDNFRLFADLVGSTIERKQAVLRRLPTTYQPPGHHARAQAVGAESRRQRRDAGGRY
jgi:hypothetical protein